MALRQQLQQRQQQKLTPLQIQVIKMTELPTVELEERIKQELVDNPALEEGVDEPAADNYESDYEEGGDITQEEITLGDYFNEEDIPDYRLNEHSRSGELRREEIPFSPSESFHDALNDQLQLCDMDDNERKIAAYIIGNIDENGYLERTLSAISDDLLFQTGMEITETRLEQILRIIQSFEPAGVGARNLQECLLLQLKRMLHDNALTEPAILIVEKYFDDLSKKHYDIIRKNLNLSDDLLKETIRLITSLNPKPGNNWDSSLASAMGAITPDFIVETDNDEVILSLNNRNIPDLRISREYANMLQGYNANKRNMDNDAKNAVLFVKQKLDSARWFIDALKQRQETLQRTMQAIIDVQYDFFLTGDETQLKPMILKDIAEKTGYDISTVSRVSNSKYVQTNFGVYPLKFFFSESMQNDAGEEISAHEIR
ncbi:MAG: RNA polymerase factor sigma-54, partial [Prevotella sp.]|nr:RNA polymerase factor sigma-54 [Prevotella sp.]